MKRARAGKPEPTPRSCGLRPDMDRLARTIPNPSHRLTSRASQPIFVLNPRTGPIMRWSHRHRVFHGLKSSSQTEKVRLKPCASSSPPAIAHDTVHGVGIQTMGARREPWIAAVLLIFFSWRILDGDLCNRRSSTRGVFFGLQFSQQWEGARRLQMGRTASCRPL